MIFLVIYEAHHYKTYVEIVDSKWDEKRGAWSYLVKADAVLPRGAKMWLDENQLKQVENPADSIVSTRIGSSDHTFSGTVQAVKLADETNDVVYTLQLTGELTLKGKDVEGA